MPFAAPGQSIVWRRGRRVVTGSAAASGYNLTSYYAAMTVQPSADNKGYFQTFADAIKAESGLLGQVRALYVTAMGDLQQTRVNMFNPSEIATIVNGAGAGVTFLADSYLKGDGTGAYVDSGIADNNATPWAQDAGSLFAFIALPPNVATPPIVGLSNILSTRLTGGAGIAPSGRIHNATAATGTTANSFGWILANRTGPTTVELDRNGVVEQTQATGATAAPGAGTFTLFRNNTGYGDPGVALWGFGGKLTSSQRVALYNAVAQLMASLGVV